MCQGYTVSLVHAQQKFSLFVLPKLKHIILQLIALKMCRCNINKNNLTNSLLGHFTKQKLTCQKKLLWTWCGC